MYETAYDAFYFFYNPQSPADPLCGPSLVMGGRCHHALRDSEVDLSKSSMEIPTPAALLERLVPRMRDVYPNDIGDDGWHERDA